MQPVNASKVQYDKFLASLLKRAADPLKKLTVNVKINGIYSLPQDWVMKVISNRHQMELKQ